MVELKVLTPSLCFWYKCVLGHALTNITEINLKGGFDIHKFYRKSNPYWPVYYHGDILPYNK